jgi:hypothetical protein
MHSEGFDKDRHYAFLRDHEDHTLLFAVNFSDKQATMKLMIPEHAFEWMGIPETENFHHKSVMEVNVAPKDAVVIQLV